MKHLTNKKLIETINSRYANNLNDDDLIAELCRRRKLTGNKIAIVSGEEFVMVKKEKKNEKE